MVDKHRPTDRRASARPTITLVGPGNLASVLGLALHAAGYTIDEVVSRDAGDSRKRARALARQVGDRAATYADGRLASDISWLAGVVGAGFGLLVGLGLQLREPALPG